MVSNKRQRASCNFTHAWHMAVGGTDSGFLLDSILSTLLKIRFSDA